MNCPLCIDQTLDITHRAGIEVDICPQCRGIWLDRGELDRLVSTHRPASPVPSTPSGRPQPAATRAAADARLDDDDYDDDDYDDDDDDDDDDRSRSEADRRARSVSRDRGRRDDRSSGKGRRKKRKRSLADKLGDVLEEVLDL